MPTGSSQFLEALAEAGVSYIFANFGSDHPGLIEAIAEARAKGNTIPTVVTSPSEFVAMSAADGYARVTGRAQTVVVHVECGTQSLAGAVHNAAKGRVPVLVFAGASPFTQEGERTGTRNEFIQWIQDVHDQRGLVRGYMKYDAELKTGANVKQMVHRALQFAQSAPMGPVYLMGAREAMEEEVKPVALDLSQWRPVSPAGLAGETTAAIVADLASAKRPLIVTSYLGRNTAAVEELLKLCVSHGIGVLESVPSAMNFPPDNPLHQGIQWNQKQQNAALAEADVVLVLDSDIPWIPLHNRPLPAARVHHIDLDVLKEQMPLFYIPALTRSKADCVTALAQLNAALARDEALVAARSAHWAEGHAAYRAALRAREDKPAAGITIAYLMAALRAHVDANTIVVNEGVTNYQPVFDHLGMIWPCSIFTSGAGSLGWYCGAALGMKLAAPEKTVIAVGGDGSYMFSQPATVHWMSRHAGAPFLTVVLNNRGWRAPRLSALSLHPDGYAAKANTLDTAFDPPPDYAGIAAAAGGAFARTVESPGDVEAALADGMRAVKQEKRSAVLDVWLAG